MEEQEKKEIAKTIAGIIMKKYGKEYDKEMSGIISEALEEVRKNLKAAKVAIEQEALLRLNRRFRSEVEPMLNMLDGKIGSLMASDAWSDVSLEKFAKEELAYVLREKAREWARKVVTSEVRFKFDDMFDE